MLEVLTLPVDYSAASAKLEGTWFRYAPHLALSFGEASCSKLQFEERAQNEDCSPAADNKGEIHEKITIDVEGPDFLESSWNVKGVPSSLSQNAGGFLCNHIFYHLMRLSRGTSCRRGFIHVPISWVEKTPERTSLERAFPLVCRHLWAANLRE